MKSSVASHTTDLSHMLGRGARNGATPRHRPDFSNFHLRG